MSQLRLFYHPFSERTIPKTVLGGGSVTEFVHLVGPEATFAAVGRFYKRMARGVNPRQFVMIGCRHGEGSPDLGRHPGLQRAGHR